ncbi:MAG: GMP/IMP nucleotidase [Gammaproteobacteria bacterium]|nr:MAG: GMP/IMP nucleotidase [Gammaproteobacteria bacterium]
MIAVKIDWNTIDTVLLDMDGTLLDLHFDNYFWLTHLPRRYAEHHGICPDQATRDLHKRFRDKRGTLDWYCLEFWSKELAVNIRELKEEIVHLIQERPYVQEFLTQLGNDHKQRVLITNAHPQSLELKLSLTGIGPLLDHIYSSHQFGQPKESPAFWKHLEQCQHFCPERTLFIDDSVEVLKAAADYGIGHLLGISQPDSKQQGTPVNGFPAIAHFNEILPHG